MDERIRMAERDVVELEGHIAKLRDIYSRRLQEAEAHDGKLQELERQLMRAEAVQSLDDMGLSGRHLHRALVDKVRLSEAAGRAIGNEIELATEQHQIARQHNKSRCDNLRLRHRAATALAAEVSCRVAAERGTSEDLRTFIVEMHRIARDADLEATDRHARKRADELRNLADARVSALESVFDAETRDLVHHLDGVVKSRRAALEQETEDARRVDDKLDLIGHMLHESKSHPGDIATLEIKRSSLLGEAQALQSACASIESEHLQLQRLLDERQCQIDVASARVLPADQQVDERLATLVQSLELLRSRKLELQRRIQSTTGRTLHNQAAEDASNVEAVRAVLESETRRFMDSRAEAVRQLDDLTARAADLSQVLLDAYQRSQELELTMSTRRLEADEARRARERAHDQFARQAEALVRHLTLE